MRTTTPLKKLTLANRGFTLIEMSIVIMLLGIAVAAFAPLYKLYQQKKAADITEKNISFVAGSIGGFRGVNGRYPCPASLTALRGDPNYGREDCTGPTTAPGTFDPVRGIWVERSLRSINYTSPFAGPQAPGFPVVRVGFVPFRHLNMREDQAYDGYGGRILYVVTEHLTNDVTFRPNEGGIEILDENNASAINPPRSAHFLVLSAGENQGGAYKANGIRLACPAGREALNCDAPVNSSYRFAPMAMQGTANQFDDIISYFTQSQIPLWQMSSNPLAVRGSIHQKPGGEVGVGFLVNNPGLDKKGDFQNTALRAQDNPATAGIQEGHILSNVLCQDNTNNDCFATSLIAGQIAAPRTGGLKCPEDDPDGVGQYMIGISNNVPDCRDEMIVKCQPGFIITGINGDGTLQCNTPPMKGCPDEDVPVCGVIVTLTAGPHGTIRTVTGGSGVSQTFMCNNGAWVSQGMNGSCNCTAGPVTSTVACGTGYTGTATRTCDIQCPQGVGPCNTDTSTCTCVGGTETENLSCASGFSGSITRTRSLDCMTNTWSSWAETNTCVCTPQDTQSTRPCTAPFTGTVTQDHHFICPDGIWQDDPEDTSGCVCTETKKVQDDPCPAPQIGIIKNEYTTHCPNGNVTVAELSRTCADPPPVVCKRVIASSALSSFTSAGPSVGSNCTCGSTPPLRLCHEGAGASLVVYRCSCE
ncbi:MAG: prepilin-type N-terminal cleavage/methylation domain-containing protein [Alphaproteobacteria bacterium]|nr:prepilin-type N-terminal cleavage/methylation domain-containing protein [Alphaproteobacteria bacterium]